MGSTLVRTCSRYAEERNLWILGDKMAHYSSYPPSFAVDGKPDTAFRSPRSTGFPLCSTSPSNCQIGATRGDTITLDMLCDVSALYAHTQIVSLVDEATVRILQACMFQTSPDCREWVSYYWLSIRYIYGIQTTLSGKLTCVRIDLENVGNRLLECSIETGDPGTGFKSGTRYFRTHLTGDRGKRWSIHEIWIRGYDSA